ncbi:MAG TPA: Fic family protein [Herbaspirillum sp.]|jgi:Fic family protein|nr:Fic family protein [Herbaspirillum sp.]
MITNQTYTLTQLAAYLDTPAEHRPFARYHENILEPVLVFSAEEAARLAQVVRLGTSDYPKTQVGKLLIDLSWASSRLEGNTYTQLDTQALIEYGQPNKDKPSEDAAMILNHKKAIEFMLSCSDVEAAAIMEMHRLLADNSLAPHSLHFLDPVQCGVIRTYTRDGLTIKNTSYLPPQAEDRPVGFINREFDRLLESMHTIADPINRSIFLMTRLPYLQPFYDVNKRTARISCNIPLITNGMSPMSFVDFDRAAYIKGMVAFYELGDERLIKTVYLDGYIGSALRYIPFGESDRVTLATNFEHYRAEIKQFVLEGVKEAHPFWLRQQRE